MASFGHEGAAAPARRSAFSSAHPSHRAGFRFLSFLLRLFLMLLAVAALLAPFSALAAAPKPKPKPNLAPALNALSTSRSSFLAGNFYSPPKSSKSGVRSPAAPAPPPPDTPSLFSALGTATSKTYRPSSGAELVLAPQVSGGWREEHFNRRPRELRGRHLAGWFVPDGQRPVMEDQGVLRRGAARGHAR